MEKTAGEKYNIEWAKANKDRGFILFWRHTSNKTEITKCCFSQWYPCNFKVNNIEFNCAEQFMMYQKASVFGDKEMMENILKETDPKEIKAFGRKVKNFDPNVWDTICKENVIEGNFNKFTQNPELKEFLLGTGDKILVEASPYDKIWGIGLEENDKEAKDPNTWKGTNFLGFCLMEVRDLIKNNSK